MAAVDVSGGDVEQVEDCAGRAPNGTMILSMFDLRSPRRPSTATESPGSNASSASDRASVLWPTMRERSRSPSTIQRLPLAGRQGGEDSIKVQWLGLMVPSNDPDDTPVT